MKSNKTIRMSDACTEKLKESIKKYNKNNNVKMLQGDFIELLIDSYNPNTKNNNGNLIYHIVDENGINKILLKKYNEYTKEDKVNSYQFKGDKIYESSNCKISNEIINIDLDKDIESYYQFLLFKLEEGKYGLYENIFCIKDNKNPIILKRYKILNNYEIIDTLIKYKLNDSIISKVELLIVDTITDIKELEEYW